MEKKKKKSSEIEYCKVCKLHHDHGSRHKFFPRHKDSLSAFLNRFRSKIADARFFLKNPSVLRPQEQSQNRVWCVFCDEDIVELGSSFACSKAINHFASSDHLKNIKQFLWKHGPAKDCIDDFRFSEADVAKWEKKCHSLRNEDASSYEGSCGQLSGTSNDIHNRLEFETKDRIETVSAGHINSQLSKNVMPLQYNTNEYQISHSELPGVTCHGSYLNMDASEFTPSHLAGNGFGKHSIPLRSKNYSANGNYSTQENLPMNQDKKQPEGNYSCAGVVGMTSISTAHPSDAIGNVHSGAPPPWLDANDEIVFNVQLNQSEKMLGKTRKLNPNRVGAAWAERRKREMEMEKKGQGTNSNTDADWLPNFGRVWQSGTRKESRKEFEKEKRKLVKTESISTEPEPEPVQIQPYISKRARRENGE